MYFVLKPYGDQQICILAIGIFYSDIHSIQLGRVTCTTSIDKDSVKIWLIFVEWLRKSSRLEIITTLLLPISILQVKFAQ